jgi:small conductance mechanosensitive channel
MPYHCTLRAVLPLLIAAFFLAATPAPVLASDTKSALTKADIDRVLATLEDAERREEIVETLRALSAATEESVADEERENVKTAAAELVELISRKAQDASDSAARLLELIEAVPQSAREWSSSLSEPEERNKWLTIGGRLIVVLASGFFAALLVRWAINRRRSGRQRTETLPLVQRIGLLIWGFVIDMAPIVAFALVSYGVLTFVDPRQETRLVAVALINASIFSRLIIALSSFLFSPQSSAVRLWSVMDETAVYAHQWTRRLTLIGVYGFFSLQAAFLLGMSLPVYETLLRLLGLVVLMLLLVLVAQNRRDVAHAIMDDETSDIDEPAPVSSLRRGFGRIWHLLVGAYLIVIYGIWALRVEDGTGYLVRGTVLTLMALAAGRLLSHSLDRLLDRGLRLSDDLQTQYPGLEKRLNRYFPMLRKIAKVLLVIAVVLVIGHAWGIDTIRWVTEGSGRIFVNAALHILLVLGFAFFVWEFASGGIENYLAEMRPDGSLRVRSARTKTLLTVARNALLVVLTVVAVLMILSELGINIGPLLAGAGVVGLAIGFGAQRLVQDVINGAFILFQDLMSVGDVVKLGDKAGVVEALSIRTVRLRDLGGVVHTIPFSSIEAVSNLTREYSFHVFDIGIAYREDVDEVISLIKSVGEELQDDPEIGPLVLEPLEVFGLDQFGDSAIVIKGRIKTKPIKQWQVGRAFNRLIKKRFDEHNVEIPFPHQTVYFGQDKDGSAPPAFIHIDQMLTNHND